VVFFAYIGFPPWVVSAWASRSSASAWSAANGLRTKSWVMLQQGNTGPRRWFNQTGRLGGGSFDP
jgi:hypothetical protein